MLGPLVHDRNEQQQAPSLTCRNRGNIESHTDEARLAKYTCTSHHAASMCVVVNSLIRI